MLVIRVVCGDSAEERVGRYLGSITITALHLMIDSALNTLLLLFPVDKRKLTGYYSLILQGCDDDVGQTCHSGGSDCCLSF